MNEIKFDIYLYISSTKLGLSVLDKSNFNNSIFFKEFDCKTNLNKKEINFQEAENFLEKNIFEIEKLTDNFLNDIYLIVDTPDSLTFGISLLKNNDGKEIHEKDIKYLIQDGKQQILSSNVNEDIIHIVVSNYIVDDKEYKFLPLNKNCKKFSVNVEFICFPKILIKKLKELFNKYHISINRILCAKYVNSYNPGSSDFNIYATGLSLVEGANKQEVVIIPKKLEKKGFFEKLFHLFS